MRGKSLDLSVYLVTDRGRARGRDLLALVQRAVAGGVTVVQLREKEATTREFLREARALRPWLGERGVPLLINDRVDVALAVRADGVHLGQDDMPPADARRLLGPEAVIGFSLESPDQAGAIDVSCLDYVAASGVFPTATKPGLTPLGLEGLRRLRGLAALPLLAIGGLHAGNAGAMIRAGAAGVAVISAICAADDPRRASAALAEAVRAARGERLSSPAPLSREMREGR